MDYPLPGTFTVMVFSLDGMRPSLVQMTPVSSQLLVVGSATAMVSLPTRMVNVPSISTGRPRPAERVGLSMASAPFYGWQDGALTCTLKVSMWRMITLSELRPAHVLRATSSAAGRSKGSLGWTADARVDLHPGARVSRRPWRFRR